MSTVGSSHGPLLRPRFGQAEALPQANQSVVHRKITLDTQGKHVIPNHVRIPFIAGNGIGPEIMAVSQDVINKALELCYGKDRSIEWIPMIAGTTAVAQGKDPVPQETVDTIQDHYFFVKSPLDTPKGGGMRSVNVWLRNFFDMFACIRPMKNIPGIVTPMKKDQTDMILFRENTEDTYCGVEFPSGSPEAKRLLEVLKNEFGKELREDSAIGIKPISPFASKRIIDKAIQYAIEHHEPSVTVVHKGNIMKYTEGAFWEWAKDLAREKYADKVLIWEEVQNQYGNDMSKVPQGKVVLLDRLTDAKHQDVIQNPQYDHVVVTMNATGDVLSDAYAATVGGLGVAPGANIGDKYAMFECVGGTAPDIAGQNKANPTALLLTMKMMLVEMNWDEAAKLIGKAIETTLRQNKMTGDLARHIPGVTALSTTQFAEAMKETMAQLRPDRQLGVA